MKQAKGYDPDFNLHRHGQLPGRHRPLPADPLGTGSTSSSFPYGTLAVNLLGCLAIGMLYGLLRDRHGWMGPELRAFLVVGFCGGFTTFSTFALENFAMLRDGNWVPAALYAGASLVLGIGAVAGLGAATVRSLLKGFKNDTNYTNILTHNKSTL
ncbi:MAG: fluoride efflux transporter FluC [Alistipes indistinctus]